jgi:hypothetical protein
MKLSNLLSFVAGAALVLGIMTVSQSRAQSPNKLYELRTYHASEGKLDALNARFRDHTLEIFKHHNMKSVGYWLPTDAPNAGNVLIYVLEHPNRVEADKNWAAFNADPEWKKVLAESQKDGSLTSKVERIFMTPTDYSPMK